MLENIEIIKEIGFGAMGTTYLAIKNNKEYALKIQKILPYHVKKNEKHSLWREINLYKYISTLSKKEQHFFVNMHEYKIYDNCEHIQKRNFDIDKVDKKLSNLLHKLDKSQWCISMLMDYVKGDNLSKFMSTKNITPKMAYNFLLQIINICLILYKGGFSHNDLHFDNIMIKKTNDTHFMFKNIKVPYYGYQIIAIDYGMVLQKGKYKTNQYSKTFHANRKEWLFNEINGVIGTLILNTHQHMYDCDEQKKDMPWDNNEYSGSDLIKNIIKNHKDFWDEQKNHFIKNKNIINTLSKLEEIVESNKNIDDFINKSNDVDGSNFAIWRIQILDVDGSNFAIWRIQTMFYVAHPKLFIKYFGWCSYRKQILPKEDIYKMLDIDNLDNIIKFIISKMK